LRNKKDGLDKMQEAYLDMMETFTNKTYEKEYILTKRIFQQVKNDLVCKVVQCFCNTESCDLTK